MVDDFVAIAMREKDVGAERHVRIRDGLANLLLDDIKRFGCQLASTTESSSFFTNDLELNAQGLGVTLDRQSDLSRRSFCQVTQYFARGEQAERGGYAYG